MTATRLTLGAISFSSSNHFALMPVSVNLFRLMCPTWRVQGDQIDSQMRSDVPTRNFYSIQLGFLQTCDIGSRFWRRNADTYPLPPVMKHIQCLSCRV